MSKFTVLLIVFLLMLCSFGFASGDLVIEADDHASVSEALASIPMDPGVVTLKISKYNLKDTDTELYLPDDRNIKRFSSNHLP